MRNGLLASLVLVVSNAVADCQPETPELKSMETEELVLNGPENRSMTMAVRVADDYRERGAGFQHICPATIDSTAIYFVFERPRRPSFHMQNVKAPLDIAFIDDGGTIVDIQRMEPYVLGSKQQPLYGPPGLVTAALETRAGFFKEQRITEGDWRIERRKP
jgi:uncharacterized membrane protein (UPF0127 family)